LFDASNKGKEQHPAREVFEFTSALLQLNLLKASMEVCARKPATNENHHEMHNHGLESFKQSSHRQNSNTVLYSTTRVRAILAANFCFLPQKLNNVVKKQSIHHAYNYTKITFQSAAL